MLVDTAGDPGLDRTTAKISSPGQDQPIVKAASAPITRAVVPPVARRSRLTAPTASCPATTGRFRPPRRSAAIPERTRAVMLSRLAAANRRPAAPASTPMWTDQITR
jgi:hypothetical protein